MPVVNLSFYPGRTDDQKRELVRRITDVVTDVTGVDPHDVWVLITEVPKENFGVAGELQSDA
jgi:4-oxalocrotonate tautomerase